MTTVRVFLVGVAVTITAACGGSSERAAAPSGAHDQGGDTSASSPVASKKPVRPKPPGKYEQTWKKPYGETTCREYLNRMTQRERFVAAADGLSGLLDDLPSDALALDFVRNTAIACSAEPALDRPFTEMEVGVAMLDARFHK